MLVRPDRSAFSAERKKGRPAKAMAGSAISASNQCRKVRVPSPMRLAWPAQTETASSMTLQAAKPATARQRSSSASLLPAGGGEPLRVERDDAEAERR